MLLTPKRISCKMYSKEEGEDQESIQSKITPSEGNRGTTPFKKENQSLIFLFVIHLDELLFKQLESQTYPHNFI